MKTLGPTEVKSFTRWKLKELGLKPLIWTTALSSKRTCSVIKICSRMFRRWWWFSCSVVSNSCNPMDCSPPGSSVHGISQARILEWVATSFSRGSSRPRDQTQVCCIAGRRFTVWATGEAKLVNIHQQTRAVDRQVGLALIQTLPCFINGIRGLPWWSSG